ncbi:MAG: LPS export ABC transporter periplasmic protein LptC [Candidatus Sulfobium sp.]
MRRTLLVILSLVLCSLLFYTVKGGRERGLGLHQTGNSYIEGVRIVNRKDGSTDWVLTADRADITPDGRIAYLKNMEIKIEDRGLTVHSEKGSYNLADRSLTLDGRTVAQGNSYSITSRNVVFKGTDDNLATKGDVIIKGKKFTVRGKGMDMNNAEHKVRILKDVKAVFYN